MMLHQSIIQPQLNFQFSFTYIAPAYHVFLQTKSAIIKMILQYLIKYSNLKGCDCCRYECSNLQLSVFIHLHILLCLWLRADRWGPVFLKVSFDMFCSCLRTDWEESMTSESNWSNVVTVSLMLISVWCQQKNVKESCLFITWERNCNRVLNRNKSWPSSD